MSRSFAHFLMLIAAFIWGTTFVAQSSGMETIGPLGFTAARYLVGALVILPFIIWEIRQGRHLLSAMRKDKILARDALLLGVMMFGGIALQQTALLYTKVANAAFLTVLYVPFVPILSWLLFRQIIKGKIWVALGLSVLGSYFLAGTSNLLGQWGDLLVILGAFFWAGHIIIISLVTRKIEAPFQLAGLQSIICAVLAAGPMMVFEAPMLADFTPMMPQILYAGVLSVGAAYTIQLVAQRYSDATTAAFILSLEGVFAAWAGWQFLNESLPFIAIFGCMLIFLAVSLADVVPEGWLKGFLWHRK